MQEVLDLVVDHTSGRAPVQPFRSPMIKAPLDAGRYGASGSDRPLPHETPGSDGSHVVGGGQPMKFLHGSNRAYETN